MNEPRSSRYHRLRRRTAVAGILVAAGALAALVVTGGSVRLRDLAGGSAAACALLIGLTLEAAVFPLTWYRTFRLERLYGLSAVPWRDWLADYAKGAALILLAFAAGAEVAYALMRGWPAWWWVPTAAAGVLFSGLLTSLAPMLILPLFHPSRPVARAALQERLRELSRRAGVPVLAVHEWPTGERERRARAALVGTGAMRRVLLTTSLLEDYSDDEIEVVLAHELAHHVHGDVLKEHLAEFLVLLSAGFAAASVLNAGWPAFGLTSPIDVAGMPVLLLVFGGVAIAAAPLLNVLSRRSERRADEFALANASRPEAFIPAVRRMAAQNLVEERPSRAALWLFHTHPSVDERIRVARELDEHRSASAVRG